MTSEDQIRAELGRVGEALTARTEDVRRFSATFFPKLTAVETGGEGQSALVSVLVKQMVAPFYHACPAPEARQTLAKALEDMATQIRSARIEKSN